MQPVTDSVWREMQRNVERLDHQINGNGGEGIQQKMDDLILAQARREGAEIVTRELEKHHHEQNRWRLNLILGVVTACLTLLGFYLRR